MSDGYWTRSLTMRLSRRRALAASGGAAAAAAILAACGSSGSSSKGSSGAGASQAASNLTTKIEDTSKTAKHGGTLKTSINTDVGSWDPHTRGSWFGTLGAVVFSRLTIIKPGLGQRSSGDVTGDLAQSWETSPDGLTVTFKLRPNAHFHPVAPVNGRAVDAQDVISSWAHWQKESATRATIDNSASKDAPVTGISAPDSSTIVMKLAFPAVTLPSLLSGSVGQSLHILPKELDGGYNPRNVAIGSGPFYVSEQVPSAYVHFKRNPGYHLQDLPWPDAAEYPVVTEYATGLAAFKAGQLYLYPVHAEDVLQTKNDQSALNVYQGILTLPTASLFFGYKNTPGGMFRDKRLRQAYSMSIDRDLFAETWFNVSKFTGQGLPVTTAWSSVVPADEYTGWWLDPQSKDFGPNAKYYTHDVAEAKKLITAAGFNGSVPYVSTRAGGNYGPEYDHQIDITEGMAGDAGFKPTANVVNYMNVLIPQYQEVQGEFEGTGWMLRPQSSSDPIDKLAEFVFSGSGPNFIGFDPDGLGNHKGDPMVDDLIRKSRVEPDTNKRKAIMTQLQQYMAEQMYVVRPVSGASGFDLAWPALKNMDYFRGASASETVAYYWIDQTQKPVA